MNDELRRMIGPDGMLAVRVTPKASRDRIEVSEGQVKVWVRAVPEGGKANKAVELLVAKSLKIPKSSVAVVRGQTSREKVLKIG